MNRRVIAIFMFLLPVVSPAQTPVQQTSESKCTAATAKTLTIRGIHLGMGKDELLSLFPNARQNQGIVQAIENANGSPQFGVASFNIFSDAYSTKDRLDGIRQIDITLFDDRVVAFSIHYIGPPLGPGWASIDEWITKLSETLRLPGPSEWKKQPFSDESYYRTLVCQDVQIVASNLNQSGYLAISDNTYATKRTEREKSYQDKKRREFKP